VVSGWRRGERLRQLGKAVRLKEFRLKVFRLKAEGEW